ncbi:SDR family NAD(P)-dependent oxidoreductase [Tistrella mobilis]|uniref:SDR family oxidoreductase n=1 Tax=Tistrella mobilis TaxID=171437 RepID=UPI003557F645
MQLKDKVVVVTGGGAGIGRALCRRFTDEGAKAVIAVDLNEAGAAETVAQGAATASYRADVSKFDDILAVVDDVEARFGPIDLFCSNAGIAIGDPDFDDVASATEADWQRSWGVNVMAHVHAAKVLVPRMKARGAGYFLNTVSAAGLLSQIGSATYSTTKHAAIGFAESLAIAHKDDGIRVSVLCPQGVDTAMLRSMDGNPASLDGVLTPEDVAGIVVKALDDERFLILPHEVVLTYMRNKTNDYDRWIGGMVKLRRRIKDARPA